MYRSIESLGIIVCKSGDCIYTQCVRGTQVSQKHSTAQLASQSQCIILMML